MKLTAQQINEKIAELHEPRPPFDATKRWDFEALHHRSEYWELAYDDGQDGHSPKPFGWVPRHNWSTDDGQACKLLDEMPWYDIRRLATHHAGIRYRVSWYESTIITKYGPVAKTRPLAICAAWLAWKGVEVEAAE